MSNSLNHSLTHSLNPSRLDHWGKGMEGNGREWKGRRVETSIHSSSSVMRAATASSAKPQPGRVRHGWMAKGFDGGQR